MIIYRDAEDVVPYDLIKTASSYYQYYFALKIYQTILSHSVTAPFKRSPELQASGRNGTVWLPKVSTELSAIVDSLEKAEVTIGFVLL